MRFVCTVCLCCLSVLSSSTVCIPLQWCTPTLYTSCSSSQSWALPIDLAQAMHVLTKELWGCEARDMGDVQAVYSFWQYELCDVFIELIKPVMSSGDAATQQATRETLCTCLDVGLRSLPCPALPCPALPCPALPCLPCPASALPCPAALLASCMQPP